MRGEYRNAPRRCGRRVGSSPRAWGIQALCTPAGCRNRFIPTCVGNTRPSRRLTARSTVHPHVRGEYACWGPMVLHPYGSSPRAWGIHVAEVHVKTAVRFIPTCVGNTEREEEDNSTLTVHPHVRGEYSGVALLHASSCGSSPRAWGIHGRAACTLKVGRFIPTCVGNTPPCSCPACRWSVHPHVRGEYSRHASGR